MPRILITGIQGFTGQYLANELTAQGFDVAGFGLDSPNRTGPYRLVPCNLLDEAATADAVKQLRPDAVVHLAAIAFVAHGNVDEIYRTNIVGTRNLLAALAGMARRPHSVILASSANVYGNCESAAIGESQAPAPANDYAVSKLAMEYMAHIWKEQLPITFVRPFNYTGVGQSELFLLPKIVAHFRARKPQIELGNLDVVRDFSDVRFVARCYRELLERAIVSPGECSVVGETFNICSGIGHSLQDILSLMRNIARHDPAVVVNPAFVRKNEVRTLVGSPHALKEVLGDCAPIPLEETLRWMYEAK